MGFLRKMIRQTIKNHYRNSRTPLYLFGDKKADKIIEEAAKGLAATMHLKYTKVENISEINPTGKFFLLQMEHLDGSTLEEICSIPANGIITLKVDGQRKPTAINDILSKTQPGWMIILQSKKYLPELASQFKTVSLTPSRLEWLITRVSYRLPEIYQKYRSLTETCAFSLSPNAAYNYALKVTGNDEYAKVLRFLAVIRRDYGVEPIRKLLDPLVP